MRELMIEELEFKLECLRGCFNLWTWLSQHPYAMKEDYYASPKTKKLYTAPDGKVWDVRGSRYCPACLFKDAMCGIGLFCYENCIIDWSPAKHCGFSDSDYRKWGDANEIMSWTPPRQFVKHWRLRQIKKKSAGRIAYKAKVGMKAARAEIETLRRTA